MPLRITSGSNPLARRAKSLAQEAAARREQSAFIVEGIRLIEEALLSKALLEQVLHAPRLIVTERGRALLARLDQTGIPLVEMSDRVLDGISAAETSQGVLGIVQSPDPAPLEAPPGGSAFWVIGWGLQDPGNIGTLIRTADAAGADRFLTVAGTSDPRSPKAVRASAGSVFHIPIAHGLPPDDILDTATVRGVRLFATAPSDGVSYHEAGYDGPIGFLFGREGEGLPPLVVEKIHRTVTIPMRPGVESLNVAAAAAIVLFEAARKRSFRR